uniref:Putative exocyst complex subunit sec6 n=1 Tax=Ornithodoros turicata TaxID=34597 RepID=A0A2R5LDR3_9ACAR
MEVSSKDAEATAIKHIITMLQHPEQLDKVPQFKRRVARKKSSAEAMLKTTLQSQLDGFRTALSLQKGAPAEVREVQQLLNSSETKEVFASLGGLAMRLQEVKEESMRHSQYGAAIENLMHIYNVSESVQKTHELIQNGRLLHAHQALVDLENSRDDLLYELHKLPSQSPTDRNILKQYFADVEKLSDELGKQIWLVLKRTLTSVRKEPQIIVTALRIIEREEVRDATRDRAAAGFVPPGRPKGWRKRCFEVLESAVEDRIEGNQFEERHDNKMWLVRHLEVTRQIIVDDLKTVKSACVPCFPPEYEIVDRYLHMYHNCLSRHLQSIITNELEGNEYITVLGWLTTYNGAEFLGDPDLNIDTDALGPLLSKQEVQRLIEKYLGTLVANYQDWLRNALQSDVKDWHRECEPDVDSRGCYHTAGPMIVFQMVDQHLHVAKTVGPDLIRKVLSIGLEETSKFVAGYMGAVTEFKEKHFEDRSKHKYFTHYVIAVANNSCQFQQLFEKSYRDCCNLGNAVKADNDLSRVYHRLQQSLARLQERALDALREELFLDLNKELADIMTRKWLMSGTNIVDTMSATVEDYLRDYTRLLPSNLRVLLGRIQAQLARSYVQSILQRKITFKGYEERRDAAEKIIREGEKLKALFHKSHPQVSEKGSSASQATRPQDPLDALPLLAEVLKMKDTSLLSLEVSGLIKRYPDISGEHLQSLLLLRGDMGRNEARSLVAEMRAEDPSCPVIERSIFSEITLT